ncbi:hypothetical protein IWT25_02559 [Secundilactobacillus pentosiphilus]|uniref:Uncharacterized protein n=1 Tax=Secundilactobacillus pentosiphilus TaxID=1714682 RepID=A0A1Z5IZF2_9LACO|nr:XkdX family protein [Secundilactobacillus pentosiphilus]GAX07210.1 hypothetical protein IWT25_02559 [Secundilactobacillus pentosiphilus]
MADVKAQPDYVLVPNPSGGYTKMDRATAKDTGQTFVEVPSTGTPRSMINPVYDATAGTWSDTVATQKELSDLTNQVASTDDVANQAALALQALTLAVAGKVTSTPLTNWADRIKSYRSLADQGGWTDDQVANAVTVSWITADDYAAITGKSYVAPTEGDGTK